jgi:hypothetical protein
MEDRAKSEKFGVLADAPHIVATSERLTKPTRLDYRAVVADVPHDIKLAVCTWVIETCVEHARAGGTFRNLVFERLGFGIEAWLPLYLAGGMDLYHHFNFCEASAADESVRTNIARVADHVTATEGRQQLIDAMFRFEQLAEAAAAWTVVIRKQREDINSEAQYIGDLVLGLRSASALVGALGRKLSEVCGNSDLGEQIDKQLRLYEQAIDRVQHRE